MFIVADGWHTRSSSVRRAEQARMSVTCANEPDMRKSLVFSVYIQRFIGSGMDSCRTAPEMESKPLLAELGSIAGAALAIDMALLAQLFGRDMGASLVSVYTSLFTRTAVTQLVSPF